MRPAGRSSVSTTPSAASPSLPFVTVTTNDTGAPWATVAALPAFVTETSAEAPMFVTSMLVSGTPLSSTSRSGVVNSRTAAPSPSSPSPPDGASTPLMANDTLSAPPSFVSTSEQPVSYGIQSVVEPPSSSVNVDDVLPHSSVMSNGPWGIVPSTCFVTVTGAPTLYATHTVGPAPMCSALSPLRLSRPQRSVPNAKPSCCSSLRRNPPCCSNDCWAPLSKAVTVPSLPVGPVSDQVALSDGCVGLT